MMSWLLDCIPVVGTVYRAGNAVAAHIAGDHKEANRHWVEAGMDVAGIALGLVTGGAGKVETTATKVGAKAAKMSLYGIISDSACHHGWLAGQYVAGEIHYYWL